MFDYSPYETDLDDSYKNTTSKNLALIESKNRDVQDSVFTVALISDPHYHYDELKEAVSFINTQPDIDFVIVNGDITDQGLVNEYKLFHDAMGNLHVPYLTTIGNHDYLSDGEKIYDDMYGECNYSFVFANTKFILFDDIFWESRKTPDFSWLQSELANSEDYNHTIVCAHIPPNTDQFDAAGQTTYTSLMRSEHVGLSIHGHQHGYYYGNTYNDSIPYLTVPWVKSHSLVKLSISRSALNVSSTSY